MRIEELDRESDMYPPAYAGNAAGINQNRKTIRDGKDQECIESHA